MNYYLKKFIAVILAVTMMLSLSIMGFAESNSACDCEHCPSIVIPGIFQSKVRLFDENGSEMLNGKGEKYTPPFFLESTKDIVKSALKEVLAPFSKLLFLQKDVEKSCAKAIADVLGKTLLGNLKLDSSGHVLKDVKADKYNTSIAGLTKEQKEYALNAIPLHEYVKIAGEDHLYFLSYLSTGNIKETAEELFDLIQTAKRETGHNKVNLIPISQGGSIANALMQLYRDKGLEYSDDINRVCYIVPAADGAAVLGDIYHNGILDDSEALYGYMFPSLLGYDNYLSYLITLLIRLLPNADINNILDMAVETLIEDYLEYTTCIWALVPSKDYPDLRERYLNDPEDALIREQTDWYYNAQINSRNYIIDAQKKGVEFFDIVDYNYTLYRICDSWDKVNADGIIHLDSTSFGATSLGVDVSLPEDYVQANTYCTNPEHNHMDENRIVDASTGVLCESTFFFKNQDHVKTADNDVIMRLAVKILTDSSFKNVYSDTAYPQFNFSRDAKKAKLLYNKWENFDPSKLSEADKLEFISANENLKNAIDSTYMPTEEYDAAVDRFNAITYKIETGAALAEKQINRLASLLTKMLKFWSDFFLKFFGGKGFSDFIC